MSVCQGRAASRAGSIRAVTVRQDRAGRGGACRVWDIRASRPVRTLETGGVVTSIEVSEDGRHVTTADGSDVRIWDGATLETVKSFKVRRRCRPPARPPAPTPSTSPQHS